MHRFSGTEIHPGGATQDECGWAGWVANLRAWWFSAVMSCLRTCLGKDPGANICARGRLPFTHPSPNVWTNVHPHKQRACWQDLLSETQHGFLLACSLKRLHLLLGCTPIHGIYNLKSWQQRLVVGVKKIAHWVQPGKGNNIWAYSRKRYKLTRIVFCVSRLTNSSFRKQRKNWMDLLWTRISRNWHRKSWHLQIHRKSLLVGKVPWVSMLQEELSGHARESVAARHNGPTNVHHFIKHPEVGLRARPSKASSQSITM